MKSSQPFEATGWHEDGPAADAAPKPAEASRTDKQLERLQTELDAGNTRSAAKVWQSLATTIEQASKQGEPLPTEFRDEHARLGQKLRELKDWQGFVTRPKRIELCGQMDKLRDESGIHPAERARAIKEMQDAWRALGPSDSREDQRLWSQFKKAADIAFAPCAEFFSQQKIVRDQNLKERMRICAELEAYDASDWDNVDWRALIREVAKAKQGWRQFDDVPRASQRNIQKRFSAALTRLQARIGEEEARNHERKAALIDQVKSLVAETTITALDRVKKTKDLQSEWKQVGITNRRKDQRLWKSFRAQCDAVFTMREEEARAEHEARKTEQRTERLGRATKQQNKHHQFAELRRKADLCSRYERGGINLEELDANWESEVELGDMTDPIEDRRSRAIARASVDCTAAESLCIRLEMLAGIESPPDSRNLRMKLQVERLNRELSQGQKETRPVAEQAKELLMAWYCATTPAALHERFTKAESLLAKP